MAAGKISIPGGSGRKMLVLDASYPFETIRNNKLEDSITCRDLDGFFQHVWTVHPFASLVTSKSWTSKYGKPQRYTINASHSFIEGKVGRFSFLRWISPVNFLFSQIGIFFTLHKLITKEGINVIRAGDPLYLGILGWLLARLCKIPLVIRVGGNYDEICKTTGHAMMPKVFFTRKIEKKFERFILSHADLVAGANQDNLNFAIKNGARPQFSTLFRYGNLISKYHFIEPAKRHDGTALLSQLGVTPKRFILYIGRLETVKLADHVIKVLADLRKGRYEIKAVLAGEGQCLQSLINLSKELDVNNETIFCGSKDQEWLSQVIPLAAAVVSPHTGRALLEVALGGAPVAAYDIDWQGELIENGITGELVPYGDHRKLANAVERFLSDPVYSDRIGKSARKRALEMMDPVILNEHERNEYVKLFNRTKKN